MIRRKPEMLDVINYTLITLICVVMLYPFMNVVSVSLSSYSSYVQNPLMVWPEDVTLGAYKEIMKSGMLWRSYANTIIVTVSGVGIGILLYILTAYPLSKKALKGRRTLMLLIVFTMLFNGGLIPNFYLMRSLDLLDTLASLVLPALLTGFNLILMKNFFESLPEEIEEAARIDGASDPYILFRIVVPLSKPIIATLCLFAAVGYWNNFFNAIVYIRNPDNWPLMLYLREVIEGASTMARSANAAEMGAEMMTSETIKYATLVLVMIPILCVYPFLQKYFVKGIMLGSVKG
ncbi:carbohydrate ABC transporter permease [Paenibacillus sp. PAMC21692]|uniref:carbohydrate ABC transporter permease n=1 Tax=Paenibacillus sp. PAMC21692 TaxID=2762320 RepID=UPI00164ED584|nr:carbohydrate ABC transporter permease [Paenibacillus sp. PAMC21692]QNK59989.1 carbohydrate ABC transporter permease [Paenibacillus sp. PAMC21692]